MASKIPYLMNSIRFNYGSRLLSPLSAFNLQKNTRREAIAMARFDCFYSSSAVEASELESDELHDDAKAAEKDTALHTALSQLVGEFDGESMLFLQRFFRARVKPVVSTGSLKLDLALGIGGLPKGRVIEIYGHEGSGKTTLALHIIKEAQKLGGYCAYLDVENALDPLLMESIGVNSEHLLYSQPDSAENLLSIVDTLVKTGSVDVIVVDSVAALIPESEIKNPVGDKNADTQSKMMTQALRKIHYSLCRSETVIIFINQVRHVKTGQGVECWKEVTCGGNALPFYSAVRLRIARKGLIKTDEEVTGLGICIEVIKNKLAPAMKKAELEIRFGRGIASAGEVLELACEHGVVVKEGNCYFIDGEVLSSKAHAENYLVENGGVRDKLVKCIRSKLFDKDGSLEDS